MRFTNLRVARGVAGDVGVGHLQVIDFAVSHIQHAGDLALSHALWEFTQMVVECPGIDSAVRRAMVERLASVADRVVAGSGQPREAGAVLADLEKAVAGIPGLASGWATLHPLLHQVLA